MALKFTENFLVGDKGEIYPLTYEQILSECLKDPFENLSIVNIVFNAIERLTGEKVLRRSYNESKLYSQISKEINQNPRFQNKKDKSSLKRKLSNEREKIERRNEWNLRHLGTNLKGQKFRIQRYYQEKE